MPSLYDYHLKFELYPTQDPEVPFPVAANDIWTPADGATIFDDLPAHPRRPCEFEVIVTGDGVTLGSWQRRGKHTEPVEDCIPAEDRWYKQQQASPGPSGRLAGDSRNINVSSPSLAAFHNPSQWKTRSESSQPSGFAVGLGSKLAAKDWRFGRVSIESFDLTPATTTATAPGCFTSNPAVGGDMGIHTRNTMATESEEDGNDSTVATAPAASLGPTLGGAGQSTRARYVPFETKHTEVGWGIVHLYREDAARARGGAHITDSGTPLTSERAKDKAKGPELEGGRNNSASPSYSKDGEHGRSDQDTILCIPAVPSYLSPNDFLGFVGEKWRGDVSHYRMVMTSQMNRYMVLMKFRDGRRAKEWQKAFDGKVFNSMESEICHVTFIKSITVDTPTRPEDRPQEPSSSISNSLKPLPPPTADLVELPTCPVCLERMDDTAGLMTILCQHVFHCTCLQTWKGSGCPVCRATNPSLLTTSPPPPSSSSAAGGGSDPLVKPFGQGVSNLCSVCDCSSDLWICLICGNVGCGRYKGGHAKEHWKETAHSFSLELETQYVWDYAGDMWVHRLIRGKSDGKVFELPGTSDNQNCNGGRQRQRQRRRPPPGRGNGTQGGSGTLRDENGEDDDDYNDDYGEEDDVVPRAKLDRIGLEYTHLLTSQLESQRIYFEELVNKAAEKAAKASAAAEQASSEASDALRQLAELRAEHTILAQETVPPLERDVERERRRADKASELARCLGKSLQEEKKVGEGLMARIRHLNGELEGLKSKVEKLALENGELKEANRDLTMFISGQEKLRELENEGKVAAAELEGGTVSVPTEERKGKGKGKGRAKR